MRIVSWNVNGIRAAWRKGLWPHLKGLGPDATMLQEIRCLPEQAPDEIHRQRTFETTWHPAERKGYAGTLTWTRGEHVVQSRGIAGADDSQGRVLTTLWRGVRMVNVYLPSGSRSDEAQASKEAWMDQFLPWLAELAQDPIPTVVGGDLNIAHTENDIHNPSGNKRNSGFLPHERSWFTDLLQTGWTDTLRTHLGEQKGPYSWWSNRGQARALNRGWRIDYLLLNRVASDRLLDAGINRAGGMTISDHAPIWIDLEPPNPA